MDLIELYNKLISLRSSSSSNINDRNKYDHFLIIFYDVYYKRLQELNIRNINNIDTLDRLRNNEIRNKGEVIRYPREYYPISILSIIDRTIEIIKQEGIATHTSENIRFFAEDIRYNHNYYTNEHMYGMHQQDYERAVMNQPSYVEPKHKEFRCDQCGKYHKIAYMDDNYHEVASLRNHIHHLEDEIKKLKDLEKKRNISFTPEQHIEKFKKLEDGAKLQYLNKK